jgi:hypothetical protein
MPITAFSADGNKHIFPDDTDQSVIDTAMKKYAQTMPKQEGVVADVAKEAGKGMVRGPARAIGDIGEAIAGPFGPQGHFQNLMADIGIGERAKPAPPYGEQIIHAAGAEPTPKTTAGRYTGAVLESVFNPESYLGPGGALVKGGAAAASGLGSEALGHAAEGTGLETPARMVGGLFGPAAATTAAERSLSKMASQLPQRETLKNAASQIYKSLEQSNVRISPVGMDDLVRQIKTDLNTAGFRSWQGAPGAPIYQTVEELATSGGTVQGVDAVRKVLGRFKPDPANAVAADRAIDAIDDFMMHVDPKYVLSGNPQEDAQALKYAQSLWASNKQLEIIEEGSIKGQRRAGVSGSGANRINTARQEINRILGSEKKSRGMSRDVKDRMEEIVLGTWLTNRTRQLGKFAPSGPVSATTSILTGMGAGAGAGASVAAGGLIAKYLGEYLTQRQIRELEDMIRAESPIGAPIAQANAPRVAQQKAVPAAALGRAALTSPLMTGAGSGLE